MTTRKFDASQARDDHGRWSAGGGSTAGRVRAIVAANRRGPSVDASDLRDDDPAFGRGDDGVRTLNAIASEFGVHLTADDEERVQTVGDLIKLVERRRAKSATGRIEIKASFAVDDAGTITGIAWPFGAPDRMGDVIEKGAFAGAAPPIPMLAYHDPEKPVGAWDAIAEKSDGLHVSGRLLVEDVPLAREVRALVRAGALRGLSIGFVTKKAMSRKGGGRTIQALDLAEISLVTIPMHPSARITGAKSAAAAIALAEAINRAAAALRTR